MFSIFSVSRQTSNHPARCGTGVNATRALRRCARAVLTLPLTLALLGLNPSPALTFAEPPAAAVTPPQPETGSESSPAIHLKSREFAPGTPSPVDLRQTLAALAQPGRARIHVIVQLDIIPRKAARAEYERSGLSLLAYLPDRAWIASVPGSNPAALLDLPGVTWAGELTTDDKLDPQIRAGLWDGWALAAHGDVAVTVVMHPDETLETGRALVEKHGGLVSGMVEGIRMLMVEIPPGGLRALAGEDAVQWVEAAELPLRPANDGIREQLGVNALQAAPYGLDGTGIDVLVYDSGRVGAHADFGARVTAGDAGAINEHSTHVAGTIGGSGANSASQGGTALQWRGVATNTDLISYAASFTGTGPFYYQNVPDIERDFAQAQNTYGADIGTASLGASVYANYPLSCTLLMGKYGASSALIDQIVRGGNSAVGLGDKYVTTWAAGNERNQTNSCSDTYGSIAPPAAAKNPIQVGASNTNDNSMTSFSSWGPTQDGRLKPTIVAGGCQTTGDFGVKSTDNSPVNAYKVLCGTSSATAAVAGGTALMLEKYRAAYSVSGNFWPSSAKAILIQTASDFGNPGPDYQWGYGQARLQEAVDLIGRRGLVQANIDDGETLVYAFPVTDVPAAQVSLAWDDFEATFNANPTLINDLDLELVAPSGTLWRPWVLNPATPAITATRGINTRDNQEQVTVPTPEKGTWLVRVKGAAVPNGPQDFSLACEGCREVNAGVCQITVEKTPLGPNGETPDGAAELNSEGDQWLTPTPAAGAPESAGQRWQRMLEEPTSPLAADRARANRIAEALRDFDAARNAGPEAVIAFAASAGDDVRALIADEVEDARATPRSAILAPVAPAAFRVGVDGVCAYNTVQEGINAASNGATVRVAADFFAENIDIGGGKIITIEGGYDATCAALTPGARSRVDGAVAGSVVDMSGGAIVTFRNLTFGWGSSFGAGIDVLGSSQATLSNTRLTHNNGASGGGMYIGGGSQVTLTNGSLVQHNTGTAGGGAIVFGRLNALDTSSDLTGNCSTTDGGGAMVSGGTLFLSGADMHANQAMGATGRGGAIFATGGALVTMTASSFIGESSPCCNAAYDGAGIYADHASIASLGGNSTILQNKAANNGGGLYLANGSVFSALTGTNVGYDGQAGNGNTAILGAGIYADGSAVAFAGRIINNDAANSGGGMYASASAITLTGASVGGSELNQSNSISTTGLNGAGLYLINNTHAWLSNTVISGNTLSNPATGYGGGAYVRAGSYLTATNSQIERHVAPSAFDGRGAGLYIYDSTVTLANTRVSSNTAANLGGGARLFGSSALNVLGGSTFVNNRAGNGVGGAIAGTNAAAIDVNAATFQSNTASIHGGAIYLDSGALDATGWFDFRYNGAGGNGGAVAVSGAGTASFAASGDRASHLDANTAGGNGGALHVSNATSVRLHATAGQTLTLSANDAGGDGGGAHAGAGAYFDVYGQFQAASNHAGGNGGAFFLAGGSRIWLDDFFNTRPQVLANVAANGGAIHATDSPRVECDGVDFGAIGSGNSASAGSGGAVLLRGSLLQSDNCVYRDNQARAGDGGAIAAFTSTVRIDVDAAVALAPVHPTAAERGDTVASQAPQATNCNALTTQCSRLSGNSAISSTGTNGNGGAVFASASAVSINGTYLHRNTAARGGALYQEGASARSWISNTLIYSNTSQLAFGAGIRNGGGAMTLTHVTAANNTGGSGFSPGAAQSYVYNTIIYGNSTASFGALTKAVCNIDQGGTAGASANPLYIAPGAGENYRLQPGSPAFDACASGLAADLDNRGRPFGAAFDMGAYESSTRYALLPVVMR